MQDRASSQPPKRQSRQSPDLKNSEFGGLGVLAVRPNGVDLGRCLLSALARLQLRRFLDCHAEQAEPFEEVAHALANQVSAGLALDPITGAIGCLRHIVPVCEQTPPVTLQGLANSFLSVN